MVHESLNEALIACVKACGGSKQVGHKLWPEKTVDSAQRHLLACLDESKAERLSPLHLLLLLRLARDKGCHEGIEFIASELGYSKPEPVSPVDETAELQRQFVAAAASMSKIAERIERLQGGPALRVA